MITTLAYANRTVSPSPTPRDEQAFDTPSGKAVFTVHDLPDVQVPKDHYVLMTLRSHDQYNTTIYGLHDDTAGSWPPSCSFHERQRHGETRMEISSNCFHYQPLQRRDAMQTIGCWCLTTYLRAILLPISRGNCLVPLHSTADVSNTPTSKWIVCTLSADGSPLTEEE